MPFWPTGRVRTSPGSPTTSSGSSPPCSSAWTTVIGAAMTQVHRVRAGDLTDPRHDRNSRGLPGRARAPGLPGDPQVLGRSSPRRSRCHSRLSRFAGRASRETLTRSTGSTSSRGALDDRERSPSCPWGAPPTCSSWSTAIRTARRAAPSRAAMRTHRSPWPAGRQTRPSSVICTSLRRRRLPPCPRRSAWRASTRSPWITMRRDIAPPEQLLGDLLIAAAHHRDADLPGFAVLLADGDPRPFRADPWHRRPPRWTDLRAAGLLRRRRRPTGREPQLDILVIGAEDEDLAADAGADELHRDQSRARALRACPANWPARSASPHVHHRLRLGGSVGRHRGVIGAGRLRPRHRRPRARSRWAGVGSSAASKAPCPRARSERSRCACSARCPFPCCWSSTRSAWAWCPRPCSRPVPPLRSPSASPPARSCRSRSRPRPSQVRRDGGSRRRCSTSSRAGSTRRRRLSARRRATAASRGVAVAPGNRIGCCSARQRQRQPTRSQEDHGAQGRGRPRRRGQGATRRRGEPRSSCRRPRRPRPTPRSRWPRREEDEARRGRAARTADEGDHRGGSGRAAGDAGGRRRRSIGEHRSALVPARWSHRPGRGGRAGRGDRAHEEYLTAVAAGGDALAELTAAQFVARRRQFQRGSRRRPPRRRPRPATPPTRPSSRSTRRAWPRPGSPQSPRATTA